MIEGELEAHSQKVCADAIGDFIGCCVYNVVGDEDEKACLAACHKILGPGEFGDEPLTHALIRKKLVGICQRALELLETAIGDEHA